MLRAYSISSIKHNRAASISIATATLIAAAFLSLLCCLFYNIWTYEVDAIIREEGGWHGRVTVAEGEGALSAVRAHPNVESAAIHDALSGENGVAIDVTLHNARTAYRDMPAIAALAGVPADSVSYHELLLSRYLIHDPLDPEPPLLLRFYLAVLLVVSLSLILIIHNAFAVSMRARIRQLGMLSSVGATPRQIRACLMQEAAMLCAAPILLGVGLGVALGAFVVHATNLLASDMAGRHAATFQYHPLVLAATLLAAALTALVSARLPAGKLSRVAPLAAIRDPVETHLTRRARAPVLSALFGVEGELAGAALKAQKKALRTASLSFTLSFLGFAVMLCFFTLSDISTRHTYFERYRDAWDVMVTIPDTKIEDFAPERPLSELPDARSVVAYQKAAAACPVPADWLSDEVRALGGVQALAGDSVAREDGAYIVHAPVIIMDDAAFLAYCAQIGITPTLGGVIVVNRIWDSINSTFRYRTYVPFVNEDRRTLPLRGVGGQETRDVPILAYTQAPLALREEYPDYALTQFVPASLWKDMSSSIGAAEPDTFVRILAREGADPDELDALEADALSCIGGTYAPESGNRVREELENDSMLHGFKLLLGGFCALLALIGIANVFSNTLGFLRQRRREFARYMSIGMTKRSVRKMLCLEALLIAGRPLLITLLLTIPAVAGMIAASHIDPMEFIVQAPIAPVLLFAFAVFGFVGLAYCIGGKKVLAPDLSEALRSDLF